ncbi:outer membrane biosynthesis protein TonB [Rhodopseudomonas rhenobacensis]|uniref:Outer membrane biosynthesis protein TonB n=1 Tax=Rhodopseudomonas rhenobacensis TaxID=87461 RepID=A0A7W8DZW8_9BRAD|nr:hypothetical protein [Rhodopseudomonas rhenobacensis]MBB5047241.1 outer membrane biosynthesis protein TonB [Rhodopseudomonas rhenobacensis]
MDSPLLMRLGAAASVTGHVAVLALLLLAGVYPYESVSSNAINVELVPAEEVKPPELTPPASTPPQPQLPSLEPSTPAQPEAAASPEPPSPQAKPAGQPQQTAALDKPEQRPSEQPAQPSAQPEPPQQPAAPQPAWPPPMAAPQPPDVTERFHVMLGLPAESLGKEVGGEAAEGANIAASDTEKLRAHLRGCAALPGAVAPTDKVRIVIRIALTPEGRLASPPALIEASASAKGPLLMQAAIKALQDCQPYAMLPADKYQEWRVLDIGFTPQDFKG